MTVREGCLGSSSSGIDNVAELGGGSAGDRMYNCVMDVLLSSYPRPVQDAVFEMEHLVRMGRVTEAEMLLRERERSLAQYQPFLLLALEAMKRGFNYVEQVETFETPRIALGFHVGTEVRTVRKRVSWG